jgi:hypothetical protein
VNFEYTVRYNERRAAQALATWFQEAQRIATEFQRTGDAKHLRAFCKQVGAMMAEIEKALPK